MTYREYIQSNAWRTNPARLREFQAARFECRLCPAKADEGATLESHHRVYDRLGCERDGDLTTLCSACHREVTSFLRARHYALLEPLRADVRPIRIDAPLVDPTRMEVA
ncbi:hypothetical protein FNL55_07630 [Tardiphaga sp. vice352]|uniref:hypothetical protein n=1 Tax=unclassified Tardiphaga TaxID=2631404 RepID=UPI0011642086|nr:MULTISPECIES: hypothetical protein [unclassified Tardiphaga]QDM15837.1 hypothetical protein FNL53_07915 [Tardiphaga sp. vice278]QDM20938.1 hypothetical protein FIU28_07280 [Tardiphaga sp. vice154]QDM26031.1 hypothetical protein FNL56_07965 [Tardiphaga sp. vice304]QDM31180.1 hypothetical protein FNL55_07630 [Tardiphaga sp. vice352]